jgi:hypothetical protein
MYIVTNIETNVQTLVCQITIGELGGIPRSVVSQRLLMIKLDSMREADAQRLTTLAESKDWGKTADGEVFYADANTDVHRMPPQPGKPHVWDWNTHSWADPRSSQQKYDQASEEVRARRNKMLAVCDWTQGRDINNLVQLAWAPYRQALREITEQPGFPFDIIWPEMPISMVPGISKADLKVP